MSVIDLCSKFWERWCPLAQKMSIQIVNQESTGYHEEGHIPLVRTASSDSGFRQVGHRPRSHQFGLQPRCNSQRLTLIRLLRSVFFSRWTGTVLWRLPKPVSVQYYLHSAPFKPNPLLSPRIWAHLHVACVNRFSPGPQRTAFGALRETSVMYLLEQRCGQWGCAENREWRMSDRCSPDA